MCELSRYTGTFFIKESFPTVFLHQSFRIRQTPSGHLYFELFCKDSTSLDFYSNKIQNYQCKLYIASFSLFQAACFCICSSETMLCIDFLSIRTFVVAKNTQIEVATKVANLTKKKDPTFYNDCTYSVLDNAISVVSIVYKMWL